MLMFVLTRAISLNVNVFTVFVIYFVVINVSPVNTSSPPSTARPSLAPARKEALLAPADSHSTARRRVRDSTDRRSPADARVLCGAIDLHELTGPYCFIRPYILFFCFD